MEVPGVRENGEHLIFLAIHFGKGPGTPQGGPVAVSGAKVAAKRVPGGRPFGPVFGFFGDPVSRSILGHSSYDSRRSGRTPWEPKSEVF